MQLTPYSVLHATFEPMAIVPAHPTRSVDTSLPRRHGSNCLSTLIKKLAYHSQQSGWLVFIDPPAKLNLPLLTKLGVDSQKIMCVRSNQQLSKTRCLELALQSKHTSLVVCGLQGLQDASLSRLKNAAESGASPAIILDNKDLENTLYKHCLH